jgi:hypothetical protein
MVFFNDLQLVSLHRWRDHLGKLCGFFELSILPF